MRTLESMLPIPSKGDQFAQVNFLFDEVAKLQRADATKAGIVAAKLSYIKFLKSDHAKSFYDNEEPFILKKHLDDLSLVRYAEYLTETSYGKSLTSNTRVHSIYRFKKVLIFAIQNNLTVNKTFIDIRVEEACRETELYEPHLPEQLMRTDEIIIAELDDIKSYTLPKDYVRQNKGSDPRSISILGRKNNPWRLYDNQIWYFENVLDCKPILCSRANVKKHEKFLLYLGNSSRFYKSLGLLAFTRQHSVNLLAIALIRLTGLNVSSVMSLSIDALTINARGIPTLSFSKPRGRGYKKITIKKEYYEKVKGIIKLVIDLTVGIRSLASPSLSKKLFIYQAKSKIRLTSSRSIIRTSYWLRAKYHLDFNISPARLRASFADALFKARTPIDEIRSLMGHVRLSTILKYASLNSLNESAQHKVESVFDNIFVKNRGPRNSFYKNRIGLCKDPFHPPFKNNVRQLQPCNALFKCLDCSNFKLLQSDLPSLFRFYFDIVSSIEFQNGRLPNQIDYEATVSKISQLLKIKTIIDSERISLAFMKAIDSTDVIDPVVARM
jgi:hypothetical protein